MSVDGRGFVVARTRFSIPAGVACLTLTLPALAAESDSSPRYSFGGFGTLGAVHSNDDQLDFVGDFVQPDGAGYTHAWSYDVDTRVGAQFTARFTPRFSGVVQGVAQYDYDGSYRARFEWAYLDYRVTDNLNVRAGRVLLPMFAASDTRKVGYAQAWVRPPREIYDLLPITSSDGASLRYRRNQGEYTHTVEGNYGQNNLQSPGTIGVLKARQLWGVSYALEHGGLTARAGHQQLHLSGPPGGLFDAFRMFGAPGAAIAERYAPNGKRYQVEVLGASYDPGAWFLSSELAYVDSRSFLGRTTAWYLGGGLRSGKFTVFVNHADANADHDTIGIDLAQVPAPLVGAAIGLNAAANGAATGAAADQRTETFGARWDFARSADLKLQVDYTRLRGLAAGVFTNAQPGRKPDGSVTLFSVTVDFVF